MIKAVIIDDEKGSIDTLKWKLENYCPDVNVKASFEVPAEGVSYLKKHPPDLLFLENNALELSFQLTLLPLFQKLTINPVCR